MSLEALASKFVQSLALELSTASHLRSSHAVLRAQLHVVFTEVSHEKLRAVLLASLDKHTDTLWRLFSSSSSTTAAAASDAGASAAEALATASATGYPSLSAALFSPSAIDIAVSATSAAATPTATSSSAGSTESLRALLLLAQTPGAPLSASAALYSAVTASSTSASESESSANAAAAALSARAAAALLLGAAPSPAYTALSDQLAALSLAPVKTALRADVAAVAGLISQMHAVATFVTATLNTSHDTSSKPVVTAAGVAAYISNAVTLYVRAVTTSADALTSNGGVSISNSLSAGSPRVRRAFTKALVALLLSMLSVMPLSPLPAGYKPVAADALLTSYTNTAQTVSGSNKTTSVADASYPLFPPSVSVTPFLAFAASMLGRVTPLPPSAASASAAGSRAAPAAGDAGSTVLSPRNVLGAGAGAAAALAVHALDLTEALTARLTVTSGSNGNTTRLASSSSDDGATAVVALTQSSLALLLRAPPVLAALLATGPLNRATASVAAAAASAAAAAAAGVAVTASATAALRAARVLRWFDSLSSLAPPAINSAKHNTAAASSAVAASSAGSGVVGVKVALATLGSVLRTLAARASPLPLPATLIMARPLLLQVSRITKLKIYDCICTLTHEIAPPFVLCVLLHTHIIFCFVHLLIVSIFTIFVRLPLPL